jgi:hypothetical protein
VDGAAVAVMLSATPRETIYASDRVGSDLEELTLTLGEGPGVDAFTGSPVLVADLTASDCPQHPEVNQATGMIIVQFGVTAADLTGFAPDWRSLSGAWPAGLLCGGGG